MSTNTKEIEERLTWDEYQRLVNQPDLSQTEFIRLRTHEGYSEAESELQWLERIFKDEYMPFEGMGLIQRLQLV